MAIASKTLLQVADTAATKSSKKSTLEKPLRSPRTLAASKAKTHLLELLDAVDRDRTSVTITKRGRPVATLQPIKEATARGIFGCMKGTGQITGDVVGPEPDVWNAMVE